MDDLLCTASSRTTGRRTGRRRQSVNLTMFSDRRADGPATTGCSGRSNRSRRRRAPRQRRRSRAAEQVSQRALRDVPLALRRRPRTGRAVAAAGRARHPSADRRSDGAIYDLMPLSHLRPGHGGARPATTARLVAATVDVDRRRWRTPGRVYDLEVDVNAHATSPTACSCTTASTSSAAPTCATSSSSRRRSRTSPRSCSSRTTGRTQTILDAANAVIEQQRRAASRRALDRRRARATAIVRYHADDEGDEAHWVARTIADLHDGGDYRWGDWPSSTAPTPRAASSKRRSCGRGVPYKVVGGTRFYDRREIKDALAYLRAVVNPADEVSVKRVLNVPKRGVGDTTRRPARRVGRRPTASPSSRRCATPTRPASAARRSRGIAPFVDAARRARDAGGRGRARPTLLQAALERSGYLAELEAEHTVEAAGRLENLGELVGSAREFADASTSSSSRSRSWPTPTRSTTTTRRSCS